MQLRNPLLRHGASWPVLFQYADDNIYSFQEAKPQSDQEIVFKLK